MMKLTATFLFCVCLHGIGIAQTTYVVPTDYPQIQDAISACVNGDTVEILPGTNFGYDISLQGKAITVRGSDISDPPIISANAMSGVFLITQGEGPNTLLENLWIRNGNGSDGGGIRIDLSSPTIRNCWISECTGMYGGGLYVGSSNAVIEDCVIKSNYSSTWGGGLLLTNGGSPQLRNCVITQNYAAGSSGSGGGVACNYAVTPTLVNCDVNNNSAGSTGGGISCYKDAVVAIEDSVITDNYSFVTGGGVFSQANCNLNMTNVLIARNFALDTSGGLYGHNSTIDLQNCTVVMNEATSWGGAAALDGATLTMHQTIVWENLAPYQQGISYLFSNGVVNSNWSCVQDRYPSWSGVGSFQADPLIQV